MGRGLETKFLTILRKSFEQRGVYAYKIPDTPPATNFRFSTKKPFDMVVCDKGNFIAIEAKAASSLKPIGLKELSKHQVENLELVERAGGIALVAYNVWIKRESNRVYFFTLDDLKEKRYLKKDLEGLAYLNIRKNLICDIGGL